MNFDTIRAHCLGKPEVTEDCPFGEDVLVFRVAGKIFAMTRPDVVPVRINLKCDPERAVELRDRYEAVQPGYHSNKKHWNTVTCDGSIPGNEVIEMIDHSYELVAAGSRKKRAARKV